MSEWGLAQSVRTGREELGFTRREFAREVGTSPSTIARLELAGHMPNGAVLIAIARRLGVTVDELVVQRSQVQIARVDIQDRCSVPAS